MTRTVQHSLLLVKFYRRSNAVLAITSLSAWALLETAMRRYFHVIESNLSQGAWHRQRLKRNECWAYEDLTLTCSIVQMYYFAKRFTVICRLLFMTKSLPLVSAHQVTLSSRTCPLEDEDDNMQVLNSAFSVTWSFAGLQYRIQKNK